MVRANGGKQSRGIGDGVGGVEHCSGTGEKMGAMISRAGICSCLRLTWQAQAE
jgi:hypothetical protein